MELIRRYINRLSKYDKLALLFGALMLFFLLILGHFHKMGTYGVETDFYWAYAPDAENILNGKTPQEPGVGPGYALVLAGLNLLFDDWFLTGKLISILSAILCGYFTFKVIQGLFDSKVAFFVLILWHVTVLPFAIMAGTDMFFAFLVSYAIYLLFRSRSFSNSNLVLSAFVMGYAYLTRHNASILPLCVAFIVLLINPDSWSWSTRTIKLTIFGAAFFSILVPWLLVLQFSSGNVMRSDSYLIIASHFYGRPGVIGSEDMRLAAEKFDSLKSVVFYDFKHFVTHYLKNIYRHLYDVLIHSLKFPSFLFVGAGALSIFRKMNKRQLAFFVFPALSFLLLCLVHYEPRYYLYIMGFFVLPVAYFLFDDATTDRQMRRYVKFKYLKEVVYAVTVLFILVFSLKEIKRNIGVEPRELLSISSLLRENVKENESIIARKPHLGFLSNLETKYFPEAKTVSELLEYARQEGADYLLYGEVESQRRPELKVLLEPEKLSGEFEPILVWDEPKTVIYKLRI